MLDLVASSSTGSFTELAGTMRRRGGGGDAWRVRACRSPRADQVDGNSRFLATMFSKLLERVFSLICQNLWDSKCFSKLLEMLSVVHIPLCCFKGCLVLIFFPKNWVVVHHFVKWN